MGKTVIGIHGGQFFINGKKTYEEIRESNSNAHGLLMNARFIQGIFDDKTGRGRYNRFGKEFDPGRNTRDLISALPEWYDYGLRAFTVGFQGGGPCFTIDNNTIENNPFGSGGNTIDSAYADRMDRLIRAADEIGMAVIVSLFYGAQARRLEDGTAVLNAVRAVSGFLKEGGYTNVIIEVANEQNLDVFKCHPLLHTSEGIVALMDLARRESGEMAVGCSGAGGHIDKQICKASDVILIHGNGCSRQRYYNLIKTAKEWGPGKPIVCNEDSQAVGQLDVAYRTRTSWGYYNNLTKQEPPADWGVTPGEDRFFAYRMAEGIGIKLPPIPEADRYYLQGLEPHMEYEGKRWVRLASLYPETINYVEFYRNGQFEYVCYEEPFTVAFQSNWLQGPSLATPEDKEWKAVIYRKDGKVLERKVYVG